jgi:peptide deformylase
MKLTKKVLHNTARVVEFAWPYQNKQLADSMLDLMRREHGIGLAATQVGISKRLFVMEINGVTRACFNPEIVNTSKELVDFDEGCLSFPGESCIIKRPDNILVKYFNVAGIEIIERLTGLPSRCFQHELDHLNGITMHDRYKEQNAEQSGN